MKYAVICEGHDLPNIEPCGRVELTEQQYIEQMDRPDSTWFCPRCGAPAEWDDSSELDDVPEATRPLTPVTARKPITLSADMVNELLEYFDRHEDVEDDGEGGQRPNRAMRFRMALERLVEQQGRERRFATDPILRQRAGCQRAEDK